MKTTSVLLAGVLAIFTLSYASAKTYDISLASAVKAGSAQLKAGAYKLTVDGNKVTFVDVKSKQSFTTDGKIENAPKSYDFTRLDTATEGGATVVKDIEVGGSKIKIDF
jgi:predicted glycosyltransferase involved in capsule biosynthesis